MKQNSLQPISPQYLIDKYKTLREPDEQRDKEYCPLHDNIMAAISYNAKEHFTSKLFSEIWTASLFPERVTKQVLRLVEEFTEKDFIAKSELQELIQQMRTVCDTPYSTTIAADVLNKLENLIK